MALGARELLLVIRARDEASRAMHSLSRSMRDVDRDTKKAAAAQIERGRALSSIGVGVMAVGAAGAKVLTDWTKAAMEYNQQSAKTLTQVDKQKISLEQIKKVGLDVAKAIPAPFEEMQTSLYDIFSSMDVSLAGSKKLLTEFSKAAVAGQVSLQDAGRATIGILNAWRMGAEGVNRVNDVMFQLVRKGVGTYAQFANTIGRAVPSAVRAGQAIEDLAGMMAFLTRNGVSAAMASASAGRALDAISNPKTINHFNDLGNFIKDAIGDEQKARAEKLGISFDKLSVSVVDAKGKFRPMAAIMNDMGIIFEKLKLTGPQIADIMQELFKGSGGTIQARRFFDVAVKNFRELNSLTGSMRQSSGALNDAYNIMFKQPQTQIQLLKNNYEALKVEMGEALLPAVLKVVHGFTELFKWFNNLSPTTKKWIGYTVLIVTVLALVIGAIITVVGGIMIFVGALAAMGVTMGMAAAVIAGIVAVIAVLAGAVFLVIKYWDPIKGFFVATWNYIKNITVGFWNWLTGFLSAVWSPIWSAIKTGWNVVVTIFKIIAAVIITIVLLWWRYLMKPTREFFNWIWPYVRKGWNLIVDIFKWANNLVTRVVRNGWNFVKRIITDFWNWVSPYVRTGVNIVKSIWHSMFDPMVRSARAAWKLIKSGIDTFWSGTKRGFTAGKNAIVGIWNSIKKPMAGPVNFIIDTVWNKGIAKAWNTAVDIVKLPSKYRAPTDLKGIKAASGGHIRGPGGPTDDKIPAWLSNGEFVVRATQTKKWLPVLQAINSGLMPRGGGIPGFQLGGLVDKVKGASGFLMDVMTNPVGAMKKGLTHGMGSLAKLGNAGWGRIIAEVPKRMIDMLVQGFKQIWAKFGGGTGNAAKAIAFARAQIGKWYEWGATGPNTFDCSGLTMRAWQAAGKNITRTTYTQRRALKTIAGPVPGAVGQPHPGHTYIASRVHPTYIVEAAQTGTRIRERLLTRATPWWGYPRASGGLTNIAAMRRRGMMARGVLGNNFLNNPRKTMQAKWMGVAGDPGGIVSGFGPVHTGLADTGGYLRPGLNALQNHTGGLERILSREETVAYERGRRGMPPIIVNTNEIDPRLHAAQLGWELERRVV